MAAILNALAYSLMAYVRWQHKRGQGKLIQWLENVQADELLSRLDDKLEPLLEGEISYIHDIFQKYACFGDGPAFWSLDSFRRMTNRHDLLSQQENWLLLLWRVFVHAAHYPFRQPRMTSLMDNRITFVPFRRAFALLVLHGLDMIGERAGDYGFHQDIYGAWERTVNDKAPRIARTLYNFMASPSSAVKKDVALWSADVRDVLYYVQPEVWQHMSMMPKDFMPWFDVAVRRLSASQLPLVEEKAQVYTLRRADLQSVMQLLLSLRPHDGNWKQGLSQKHKYGTTQRAGDINSASLDDNTQTSRLASTRVTALLDLELQPSGEISEDAFRNFCYQEKSRLYPGEWRPNTRPTSTLPYFIYSFYLLWSAIFIVVEDREAKTQDSMETSLANLICFTKPAISLTSEVNYPWHSDEHRLQRDIQTASLITEVSEIDHWQSESLIKALTKPSDKWSIHYHILLLHCSHPDTTFAAFITPWTDPPAHIIMCDNQVRNQYVWRTSLLRLEPALRAWNCGGLIATSSSSSTLRLSSAGKLCGRPVQLELDFDKRTVTITTPKTVELGEGAHGPAALVSIRRSLRLTRARCFRLPRKATKATHSNWPTMPWTEQSTEENKSDDSLERDREQNSPREEPCEDPSFGDDVVHDGPLQDEAPCEDDR